MRRIFIVLFIMLAVNMAADEPPVHTEDFVFALRAFNGSDYASTFAAGFSKGIYFLSDRDNFINLKKTFTYYWPISNEWKIAAENLDIPYTRGTLEIMKDGEVFQTIEASTYIQVKRRAGDNSIWQTFTEADSEGVRQEYQNAMSDYYQSMREWNMAKAERVELLEKKLQAIREATAQGKDVTELLSEIDRLNVEIPEPKRTDDFIVGPYPLTGTYRVNLPSGTYTIRYRTENNRIMEGSEKTLICYGPEKAGDTGYNVLPGDKWTRVIKSEANNSVIYLNGKTSLYLQAFSQNSYPELFYNKTVNNQNKGRISLFRNELIHQITNTGMVISTAEGSSRIEMAPFRIEQISGASLGYSIVPLQPNDPKAADPDLSAYLIPKELILENPVIRFHLDDGSGEREIRLIEELPPTSLLLIIALFPVFPYFFILLLRRKNRQHGRGA